ncbi:MAG: DUF3105 domain-containing protein [Candidatus Methylomirabilia bacterium]
MPKGKRKQAKKFRLSRWARRRLAWSVGSGALIVAAVVVGWFAYQAAANLPGEAIPSLGNAHIQTLTDAHQPYNSDPPTSGPHVAWIAPWGIHTSPIPKELQVHNLEDGGVLVQYNCECPELAEQLRAIVVGHEKHVILAPYPGTDARIALTAWGRIDTLDEFDEKRIVRFISAFKGIDHHAR